MEILGKISCILMQRTLTLEFSGYHVGGKKKPPTKHDSEKRKTFPPILKFYHCPNLYHWKCTLGLCKRPMISSDSKENYSTIVCRHSQWGTDSFGNTENFHRTLRDTGYLGVTLGCYNFTCSNKMLVLGNAVLQTQISGSCHCGTWADDSDHWWHNEKSQKYPMGALPQESELPVRNVVVV